MTTMLAIIFTLLLFTLGYFIFSGGLEGTAFEQFMGQTNLSLLAPELVVAIFIIAITLFLAFAKTAEERRWMWIFAVFAPAMALVALALQAYANNGALLAGVNPAIYHVFGNVVQVDAFGWFVRVLLCIGTLFVFLFSDFYINRSVSNQLSGEWYVVVLTALLGGMLLAGATNLVMLFVAFETLGISSYILVGYLRNNDESAEAALKYLVYGAMSTAALLFGFSYLYGLTGHLDYALIARYLPDAMQTQFPILAVMSIMILAGFAFKLSAAPFHMWTPDVYHGAPTPVTAFLSVVSKIAGFAVALRFMFVLMADVAAWYPALVIVAVLSMIIGNVVALTQTNIKRLLAYSTIAHAGYMLLGFVVLQGVGLDTRMAYDTAVQGLGSVLYYLLTYLFMNLGAFAAIVHFSNLTGSDEIRSYAGLVRKQPWLTLVFSVMLLSLAGIPITAGFFAKFFLFQAVAAAGSQYLWLVIVALVTSTISLYYYLNVIRVMVIEEPSPEVAGIQPIKEEFSVLGGSPVNLVLATSLFFVVVLGLYANPVFTTASEAVSSIRPMHAVRVTNEAAPARLLSADMPVEKPAMEPPETARQ